MCVCVCLQRFYWHFTAFPTGRCSATPTRSPQSRADFGTSATSNNGPLPGKKKIHQRWKSLEFQGYYSLHIIVWYLNIFDIYIFIIFYMFIRNRLGGRTWWSETLLLHEMMACTFANIQLYRKWTMWTQCGRFWSYRNWSHLITLNHSTSCSFFVPTELNPTGRI